MYFVRMAARVLLDRASGGPHDLPATNMAARIVSVMMELLTVSKLPGGMANCKVGEGLSAVKCAQLE